MSKKLIVSQPLNTMWVTGLSTWDKINPLSLMFVKTSLKFINTSTKIPASRRLEFTSTKYQAALILIISDMSPQKRSWS
jgi:hypothetical protein